MRRVRSARGRVLVAMSAAASMWCGGAAADPIADFYAGKTVTIVVGSSTGGTYDLYARTIARHLGRYIPGTPRVLVQNMPGAASRRAATNVFAVAPQDGTVMASIGAALPYQPLVDPRLPNSPQFDTARVNWLPSPSTFGVLTVVRSDTPVRSVDDLRRHVTAMGTIAPGQLPALLAGAANEALGTKIRMINGHPDLNSAILAMERGEVDGYAAIPFNSVKRSYSNRLAGGQWRALLQFGAAPSPDFPTATYAADATNNAADRMLIDLAQAPLKVGYVYMLGPQVPRERVAALRSAMLATFKDGAFRAEAAKQTLDIDPVDADLIQTRVEDAYKLPPDVIERMRRIYREQSQ
jgi:tripartite-type tricarboxylate transporter receptor subunit TctC